MSSRGHEKARYQTLTDAIVAATAFLPHIPDGSKVVDASFGEFADGEAGWYWEIRTERRIVYGNTKEALTGNGEGLDFRQHNATVVVTKSMSAQLLALNITGDRRNTDPEDR